MHRCIQEAPVAFALGGVSYILSRAIDDVPDDHPLVKAAPWAFEPVDPPDVVRKRRTRGDQA